MHRLTGRLTNCLQARSRWAVSKNVLSAQRRCFSLMEEDVNPYEAYFSSSKRMPTEQDFVDFLATSLGEPSTYTTKYPDVQISDVMALVSEQSGRKIENTDAPHFIKYITELGYTEEEAQELLETSIPTITNEENSTLSVDWEGVKKALSVTESDSTKFGDLQRNYGKMLNPSSGDKPEGQIAVVQYEDVNWDHMRNQLGNEFVDTYLNIIDNQLSFNWDVKSVSEKVKSYITPKLDELKDIAYQEALEYQLLTNKLVFEGEVLTRIDEGQDLLGDMLELYPHLREEITEEIEAEDWDYEYAAETTEVGEKETNTLNKEQELQAYAEYFEKVAADKKEEATDPKKQNILKLLAQYREAQAKASALDSEKKKETKETKEKESETQRQAADEGEKEISEEERRELDQSMVFVESIVADVEKEEAIVRAERQKKQEEDRAKAKLNKREVADSIEVTH